MAEWSRPARPAGTWAGDARPTGTWQQEGSLVQEDGIWMVSHRSVGDGRFLRAGGIVYVTAGSQAADPIGIRLGAGDAVTLVDL